MAETVLGDWSAGKLRDVAREMETAEKVGREEAKRHVAQHGTGGLSAMEAEQAFLVGWMRQSMKRAWTDVMLVLTTAAQARLARQEREQAQEAAE